MQGIWNIKEIGSWRNNFETVQKILALHQHWGGGGRKKNNVRSLMCRIPLIDTIQVYYFL